MRNTLAYFASVRPGVLYDHLSAGGGAMQMRGFSVALAESTRIAVVPVNPLGAVTLSRSLRGKVSEERLQSWSTAIGLAIGGGS